MQYFYDLPVPKAMRYDDRRCVTLGRINHDCCWSGHCDSCSTLAKCSMESDVQGLDVAGIVEAQQ